ncbi:hypothetical protein POM88_021370 [Heracleum sosnowskyi]|uniref:Uncharacterized protein n=1 Tax=Heracleum sosnowskyi TaxID=360622 RepID=A0AAD8IGR9_9APIA|nr:hypothetical protein POM88_021370 [Heracleum sosnowskyi]
MDCSPTKTPMSTATKLELNTKEISVDISSYRGMVGSLLYFIASRPDIMFDTCLCARFQADPRESHLIAIKRIFSYLKGTLNLAGSCCAQILWMKNQLLDYGLRVDKIPIFCDNTNAIAITENPVQHSRTKHIDIKYHFIREHVMNGTMELHFVPSEKHLADIFTKPLDESTFSRLVSELAMTPTNKTMSLTDYIYEKNKFTTLVDLRDHTEPYHKMMKFIKACKLSYAMLAAPTLICEVIDEVWVSAVFDSVNTTITFNLKGNEHVINSDIVTTCLKLPKNNGLEKHNDSDIVVMLNSIRYALSTDNIGKIMRKCMRKEWSFFCDAFIKVFSGKISNWDVVTISMLDLIYMLLNDKYYNLVSMVLIELGAKLGQKQSRNKNIYYARVIMLLANHVDKDLAITFPDNKMECWVQNKRVLEGLNMMNLNSGVEMVYLPIIEALRETQVSISTTSISNPPISLPSSATMEVGIVQQPPTQVAKTKTAKSKSKKPTSGASQKASVAKTTTQPEGSAQVVVSGEGRGEHQENPKDKVGEVSKSQPSHCNSPKSGVRDLGLSQSM